MSSFLYLIKGQATILNLVFFLFILAAIFYRYRKRAISRITFVLAVLVLLACCTGWIPRYFAGKLEGQNLPLSVPMKTMDSGRTLILVLGSGYTLDKRLPANAQVGLVALGRLAEGIRIHRNLKNSIIVCSGYSSRGLESQAEVTKRAAIILGVEPNNIETLTQPSTTQEEANEFGKKYGRSSPLVLVTDALHMPRALKLFKLQGYNPVPAPTNYKVTTEPDDDDLTWLPSFENLGLMNYVVHEWLGDLKNALFPAQPNQDSKRQI